MNSIYYIFELSVLFRTYFVILKNELPAPGFYAKIHYLCEFSFLLPLSVMFLTYYRLSAFYCCVSWLLITQGGIKTLKSLKSVFYPTGTSIMCTSWHICKECCKWKQQRKSSTMSYPLWHHYPCIKPTLKILLGQIISMCKRVEKLYVPLFKRQL